MSINNYTYKDIIKKLKKLGFQLERQGKGSHEIRKNYENLKKIIVPFHSSKSLSKGVINSIIKDVGLNSEEFHNIK